MRGDPALQGGFVEVFQRQAEIIVKSQSLNFLDRVMLRMFRGSQVFKVELTSQTNVSFLYVCEKELVKGEGEETELWKELVSGQKIFELLIKNVSQAVLVVSQEQKFKHYELMRLQFRVASNEELRGSVMFRYERMRQRQKLLEGYWDGMCGVIKTKNPSLLLQLEQKLKKNVFR